VLNIPSVELARKVVPAWQDTARKDARTLHHCGWGTFMGAGKEITLPSRIR